MLPAACSPVPPSLPHLGLGRTASPLLLSDTVGFQGNTKQPQWTGTEAPCHRASGFSGRLGLTKHVLSSSFTGGTEELEGQGQGPGQSLGILVPHQASPCPGLMDTEGEGAWGSGLMTRPCRPPVLGPALSGGLLQR